MAHTANTANGAAEHGHHHVVPQKTLIAIFVTLLVLTVITVITATQLDIGAFNLPLALAIAGTKAYFVVAYFMALKYDSPVNRLVFTVGILFVAIFLVFTMFDTLFRGDVGNVDPVTVKDQEYIEQEAAARMSPAGGAAAPQGEAAQPAAGSAAQPGVTTPPEGTQ